MKTMKPLLIASALPKVPVNTDQLHCLETMAEAIGAQIIVVKQAYRNPTSKEENEKEKAEEWYPNSIEQYLTEKHIVGYDGLLDVRADFRVSATSANPLRSIRTGAGKVTVLGHAKLFIETLGAFHGEQPGVRMTTGSISLPQYSNTVAGNRSATEHSNRALLVMPSGDGTFEIRHVTERDGVIIDLSGKYYADGSFEEFEPGDLSVVQLEDLHIHSARKQDSDKCLDWLHKYEPDTVLMGDLIDWERYSHHQAKSIVSGDLPSPREEMNAIYEFFTEMPERSDVIVQSSNHHDHIDQWIERWEKPKTLEHVQDFHQFLGYWLKAKAEGTSTFEEWVRDSMELPDEFSFTDVKQPFKSGDRVYFHGHEGYRGASLTALAQLPVPTVSGHRHRPGRVHHAIGVGALCRAQDMKYHTGVENWAIARSVEYSNGVAELIFQLY